MLLVQAPSVADDQVFAFSGHVVSVDYAANSMVVRTHGELVSISVTPTTTVVREGQVGGIADLRPGIRVRVTGVTHNDVMTAVSIVVL